MHIYGFVNKTASRNVAFKVARMSESIVESQDELIIRKSVCYDMKQVWRTINDKQAALDDIGCIQHTTARIGLSSV